MATNDKQDSLRAIMSGHEIVIPDMQRDYCWGAFADGSKSIEKVTAYVSGIVYVYNRRRESMPVMGQIYAYEYPAGTGRLCIIDGQQRLTTLYLLLGMLYRRVHTPELRSMLMTDGGEPRLVYESRREAQYFIADLARHFFLNRDGRLSQLEGSAWFFQDYQSDPTIVSIIRAIRLIDDVLERASAIDGWDFGEFARFVTDHLHFTVCDLGERSAAEEFFVTLNTTGEPLTAAQRLRSVIGALDGDTANKLFARYNGMEEWFWRNRSRSGSPETTGDADMMAFLQTFVVWHGPFELMHADNPFAITESDISEAARQGLESMCRFFDLYARVLSTEAAQADARRNQPVDGSPEANAKLFVVLPCVALVEKFGDDATDADIGEMWLYLSNITRYQRPSATDWQIAVDTIGQIDATDTLALLRVRGASRRIVTDEARSALQFIADQRSHRKDATELMHRAQCHPVLNGRTQALLQWARGTKNEAKSRDAERQAVRGYVDRLYRVFGTQIDEQPALDPVRRALLTLGSRDYPLVRRGNSVMSLCWQDYDWQRLVVVCPALLRRLLDQSSDPATLAHEYDDRSYPYYFLIKDEALMADIDRRQFLHPCKVFVGLPLDSWQDGRVTTDTRWYVEQRQLVGEADLAKHGWSTVRAYGTRCLYADHMTLNLAIDIYYQPDQRSAYRIEVFSRPDVDKEKRRPVNIKALLAPSDLTFRFDRERRRFYSYVSGVETLISAYGSLIRSVMP